MIEVCSCISTPNRSAKKPTVCKATSDRQKWPLQFCPALPFNAVRPKLRDGRARLIQRRGWWNPSTLRADEFANGLPNLSGTLAARVKAANQLYQITCDLIEHCIDFKKYFSVENPGRSFMWQHARL